MPSFPIRARRSAPVAALFIMAVLVTGLVTSAAPALAGSLGSGLSWSIEPTPIPQADLGGLSAVACTSSSFCEAVGYYTSVGGTEYTLAEVWNGTTWDIQSTPNESIDNTVLNAVSCTSATACTAVGSYTDSAGSSTLAEVWNGTTWKLQSTPNPSGASSSELSGVSCRSAGACTAVGDYDNSSHTDLTLAEAWNGTSWTIKSTPNPSGASASALDGVSCTATSSCTAVGYTIDGAGTVTSALAEALSGSTWTIQSTPSPSGASQTTLSGVSCTSASACTATGNYQNGSGTDLTLAEAWNGTSWTTQSTPNPSGSFESFLSGIVCRSESACTAVGTYFNTSFSASLTLAEVWNGTSWKIQTTANTKSAAENALVGLACTSGTACIAIGYHSPGSGAFGMTEIWNGTSWAGQSAPDTSVVEFAGVSCSASTACTAVGYYNSSAQSRVTLVERWNGTAWSIQPTGDPTQDGELNGVSCSSPTACTAVGDYTNLSGDDVTLAEGWNGKTWSIQSTPNPASSGGRSPLLAVSCSKPTACTAVGYTATGGGYVTLAEVWNGTSWKIQSTPNPAGSNTTVLFAVSCTSATACTATGYQETVAGYLTLAEVWNGTAWKVQSTPNPSGSSGLALGAVSCRSATACVAVGNYDNTSGTEVTLAEVWNGTSWKVQSSPNPTGAEVSALFAVSCSSTSACTGAGYYTNSSGTEVPLTEVWNGTTWTIPTTPYRSGTKASVLEGVSCTSATACVADGYQTRSSSETLGLAEVGS